VENTVSNHQVLLAILMRRVVELAAAQLVSIISESVSFNNEQIEAIQLAMLEFCINAFEHSKSPDQKAVIESIIGINELEFKITDQGIDIIRM
jgi:anti-sigma regulatory factor (Ser/Thr protein kinase)